MKVLIGFSAFFFLVMALAAALKPMPAQAQASEYATLFAACRASGGYPGVTVEDWTNQNGCICPSGPSGAGNVTCEQAKAAENTNLQQESARALAKGIMSGDGALTSMGIMGMLLNGALNSSPADDAEARAAAIAEARAKAQAEQRKIEAARAADHERQRQLELSKQRILGAMKDATEPAGELTLKRDDGPPMSLAATQSPFGSTAIVPIGQQQRPMVGGLQLKTTESDESSSKTARLGFDSAGPILGALPAAPPDPAHSDLAAAPGKLTHEERVKIMAFLQANLKDYDAAEQPMKDKLQQLQNGPSPDPVAIKQVEQQIAVKEEAKTQTKKKLDLTASEDNAAEAAASAPAATAAPPVAKAVGAAP